MEVNGLNYKMDGLNKFTEYTVRVLAINRYGPSPASDAASVTTHSDGELHRASMQHHARAAVRRALLPPANIALFILGHLVQHRTASNFGFCLN